MNEELYPFSCGSAKTVRFSLAGISFPDKSYRIERPRSGVSCIEFVRRGMGTIYADGRCFTPHAGDTYFLPEGLDHLYYSDRSEPWEKIWVNFNGALARSLTECYGVGRQIVFPGLYTEDALTDILHTAKNPGEDAERRAVLALHTLFLRMAGALTEAKHSDERAERMREYLDRHLSIPATISEMAAAAGVSPSSAHRIFLAFYHITPYAYLAKARIEAAKELLLSTTLSVRSIAAHLAYADEFYFSSVFKRATGVSPGRFRRGLSEECAE